MADNKLNGIQVIQYLDGDIVRDYQIKDFNDDGLITVELTGEYTDINIKTGE